MAFLENLNFNIQIKEMLLEGKTSLWSWICALVETGESLQILDTPRSSLFLAFDAKTFSFFSMNVLLHICTFEWHLLQDCGDLKQGGLISQSFSLWLKPPKNVTNHYPEHLPFRWMVVIWHIFGEIWDKVINFLRLSRL